MHSSLDFDVLHGWLDSQLDSWISWGASQDASWVNLPTGNDRQPTLGHTFAHAFTPLHRYADQALGVEPLDDSTLDHTDWQALSAWASRCLARYSEVTEKLDLAGAGRMVEFTTRRAGVISVSTAGALTHAATHCFWHLGGLAHLLRKEGVAPPQRSDLIFWLSEHTAQ